MGKIYVSTVSNYTTNRPSNMVRHLKTQNIETTRESENFYNYCTQYDSEAAYAKHLALNDRNKAPKTLDLDVTPFTQGRFDEILELDGIYAKLEDLEHEIENHKIEQALTKMFGNQVTYSDGYICHIGGEQMLSDMEYLNLYKTLQLAYGWMLFKKSAASKCPNYRDEIRKRTLKVAKGDLTKTQIIKRVKAHIADTMK